MKAFNNNKAAIEKKEKELNAFIQKINNGSIILLNNDKIDANKEAKMRKDFRNIGLEYKILKNNIIKRGLMEKFPDITNYPDITDYRKDINEKTFMVYGNKNIPQLYSDIKNDIRNYKLTIKCAICKENIISNSVIIGVDNAKVVSKLFSEQDCIRHIIKMLNSCIYNLNNIINSIIKNKQ